MDKKERFFSSSPRLTFAAATPAAAKTSESNTTPVDSIGTIRGYAIVWNQLSTNRYAADGSTYKVRLVPGSAKFTAPCAALYEHEGSKLIGNTANGSLRVMPADDVGIPVEIDLPNTSTGRDVATLVKDKYLNGMSFSMDNGFETKQVVEEDGQTIVNALSYTVGEVTVCYDPAFTSTSIEPADYDKKDKEEDDDEDDFDDDSGEMSKAKEEKRVRMSKVDTDRLRLLALSFGRVSNEA